MLIQIEMLEGWFKLLFMISPIAIEENPDNFSVILDS